MATEPHTHPEHQQQAAPQTPPPAREREVIVTNDGGGRSGMSGVIVGVLAIVVIAIVGVLIVNAISGATDGEGPAVEVPSEVNIDTDSGGGS